MTQPTRHPLSQLTRHTLWQSQTTAPTTPSGKQKKGGGAPIKSAYESPLPTSSNLCMSHRHQHHQYKLSHVHQHECNQSPGTHFSSCGIFLHVQGRLRTRSGSRQFLASRTSHTVSTALKSSLFCLLSCAGQNSGDKGAAHHGFSHNGGL